MSPIHHHFEMCGWSEIKICGVFSLVTVIFGILSLVWVILVFKNNLLHMHKEKGGKYHMTNGRTGAKGRRGMPLKK